MTSVSPGIGVHGTGARATLNADYTATKTFYKNDSDRNGFNHALSASGNAELWERQAFIDGSASISQVRGSTGGTTSSSAANDTSNRTEVRTYGLEPYFRHHFGNWLETESRYIFSTQSNSGEMVNGSRTNGERVTLTSGRRFQVMTGQIVAESQKIVHTGDEPTQRHYLVQGNTTYNVNDQISLLGSVGWEYSDDPTLEAPPKGVIWSVGTQWHPSRRTDFTVNYNDRFDSRFWSVSGAHRFSEKTSFSVSYNESLQRTDQLVPDPTGLLPVPGLGYFQPNPDFDPSIPFTVLGGTNPMFIQADVPFSLTPQTTYTKTLNAGVSGSRGRTSFSLNAFRTSRTSDSGSIDERVLGGSVSLSRQVTRHTTASVNLSYRDTNTGGGSNADSKQINLATSLSYNLFTNTQLVLTYNRSDTNSSDPSQSVTENAVTVNLTRSF